MSKEGLNTGMPQTKQLQASPVLQAHLTSANGMGLWVRSKAIPQQNENLPPLATKGKLPSQYSQSKISVISKVEEKTEKGLV